MVSLLVVKTISPDLLISACNVVEDWVARLGRAGLVEYVQRLDTLELFLLVHVVSHHDLLEVCAGHVYRAPPRVGREQQTVH